MSMGAKVTNSQRVAAAVGKGKGKGKEKGEIKGRRIVEILRNQAMEVAAMVVGA